MMNKIVKLYKNTIPYCKSFVAKILFVLALLALIISFIQLSNSNIKYSILSLCYSGVFFSSSFYNHIVSTNKVEKSKSNVRLIYSSLILGFFIGTTFTYVILKIIL